MDGVRDTPESDDTAALEVGVGRGARTADRMSRDGYNATLLVRLTLVPAILAALFWLAAAQLAERATAAERKPPARAAADGRPPNILILLTDDQRDAGSMRVMDDTRRLFQRGGTEFINAHVTTPQCAPSRATMFSGQFAHNHGVADNGEGTSFNPDRTFQRYLDENGYRTALFGKYLNSGRRSSPIPHFDTSFRGYDAEHSVSAPRQDDFVARRALGFLDRAERKRDRRPWLMVIGFRSPHAPLSPDPEYTGVKVPPAPITPSVEETDFSDKNPNLENAQTTVERARRRGTVQQRMLLSVDDAVERIFARMGRLGEQDTLSFFTSDNGFYWGEHSLTAKYLPYLDSLRVPLYVRWPGEVERGATDERLVANTDIAPTILRATGIRPGYKVDGRSLFRPGAREWLLFEGAPNSSRPDWPAWEHGYLDPERHWFRWVSGFEELYDLNADPWQLESDPGADPQGLALTRERVAAARDCAGRDCP